MEFSTILGSSISKETVSNFWKTFWQYQRKVEKVDTKVYNVRAKSILRIIFVRGVLEIKRTLNRGKSLLVSMQASGTIGIEGQTYSGTAVIFGSKLNILLHFKVELDFIGLV